MATMGGRSLSRNMASRTTAKHDRPNPSVQLQREGGREREGRERGERGREGGRERGREREREGEREGGREGTKGSTATSKWTQASLLVLCHTHTHTEGER